MVTSGIGSRWALQTDHIESASDDVRAELAGLLGVPVAEIDVSVTADHQGWLIRGFWIPV